MAFRWKIQNLSRVILPKVGLPWNDLAFVAFLLVVIEQLREAVFEFQGNAFTHDANAVYSICENLRWGLEYVAFYKCDQLTNLLSGLR